MATTARKTFFHPHSVYELEYPAHWDAVIEKDGESCGFGPKERDDVGLWISEGTQGVRREPRGSGTVILK